MHPLATQKIKSAQEVSSGSGSHDSECEKVAQRFGNRNNEYKRADSKKIKKEIMKVIRKWMKTKLRNGR